MSTKGKDVTLSLAMICKPEEGLLLERVLKSVYKYVDEIIIGISNGDGNALSVVRNYKAKILRFEWQYNFAKARQLTFDAATKDWIMWLDCDDLVENANKIKPLLKLCPSNAMGVYVNYDYDFDKYGNVTTNHNKLRIIRRDSDFKWKGVVHENLMDDNNAPMMGTKDFNIIHRPIDDEPSSARNLDILEREIEHQKKAGEEIDPRLVYYLGVTYKAMGLYPYAERLLRNFAVSSGWDEQRYDAYINLAEMALEGKKQGVAVDYALLAIKEKPDYPDAYFQLGTIYNTFEKWEKAVIWLEAGFRCKPIKSDWIIVARRPKALLEIGKAFTNLGKFKKANKHLNELLKLWPKEKSIVEQIKVNDKLRQEKETVNSFFKIERYNQNKNKVKNRYLIKAIPKELYDNPALLHLKWKHTKPYKWPQKSIVIYCGTSWEEWSPKTVNRGIGGSEEAVIYLSRELYKLGWKVTVYNSCGNDTGEHDGVIYRNQWEFNGSDKFDILIGWRTPGFFQTKFKARKKYLWLHDVYNEDIFTARILNNLDKIIVLSKYHRNIWPKISKDKFFYSANGIIPEHFNGVEARVPYRMIYSSCPSRGLELLLDIWPEVRKTNLHASLYIYYGWENFIKGNQEYPKRMQWMENMKKKIEQPGIHFEGRIGHKKLAREFMKSQIWAYPCIFPEISCITAMKSQAAGAIPVVVPYAAVDETVGYGYKTGGTDIFKKGVKEEYKNLLLRALKETDINIEKMKKWALERFPWSKVAKEWGKELDI